LNWLVLMMADQPFLEPNLTTVYLAPADSRATVDELVAGHVRTLCIHFLVMPQAKDHRLNVRVALADADLFREAAELEHESVSQFLIESGRERAERLLADRTRFVLDHDEWTTFTAALERPAETNPAVVELFQLPRPA
jgi:uncharacterized protein (DUF1778 family)